MQYALIRNNLVENVAEGDQNWADSFINEWDNIEPLKTLHELGINVGIGWSYENGEFKPPVTPIPEPVVPPVYEWYIDLGAFFDRFGDAKMPVLLSNDAGVKALLSDINVRKWVDLKNVSVSQGIDYIATKVPDVTEELKDSILNTPVSSAENLALRKLYFS